MPKPSKQIIINAIIKGIEIGKERAHLLGTIGKRWEISRTTFDRLWKVANIQHTIKQDKVNQKLEILDTNAILEARKIGLKSKLENQLNLQSEIDIIDKQLRGEVEFTFCVGNKINKSHNGSTFMLPVQTQNDLRKVKIMYAAELSKLQGDYASTKQEITGKNGNPIEVDVVYEITLKL